MFACAATDTLQTSLAPFLVQILSLTKVCLPLRRHY